MPPRFQIEIAHQGLNKYKIIRGNDPLEVQRKVDAQTAAWNEVWEKKVQKEQKKRGRQQREAQAVEATAQAQKNIKALEKSPNLCTECKEYYVSRLFEQQNAVY